MKTVLLDGFRFDLDGDRLVISAGALGSVRLARTLLARALGELDARTEATPADGTTWVPLTVAGIGHNRTCRSRTGVTGDGRLNWSAWCVGTMQVATREYDVPQSHRDQTRYWRAGDPATVWIDGPDGRGATEYTPDELDAAGVFTADGGDRQFLLQVEVPS